MPGAQTRLPDRTILTHERRMTLIGDGRPKLHVENSDVLGWAQSLEPGPARPSKARPEAGLDSGFLRARAWLEVQKAQSPGFITN